MTKTIDYSVGNWIAVNGDIEAVDRWNEHVRQVKAEIKRLNDGIDAIRQYGSDTLRGPTDPADDTRDWQRDCVLEMTNRAVRVLNGDPWLGEPTHE